MAIRRNNHGKLIVEVYDPAKKDKVYVKPRDHGMTPPQNMRQAKALEQFALRAMARSHRGGRDETLASFFLDPWSENGESGCGRWSRDFPNGRAESTLVHNSQRVRPFAERFRDRTLRSITRAEARRQANDHEATIAALRADQLARDHHGQDVVERLPSTEAPLEH